MSKDHASSEINQNRYLVFTLNKEHFVLPILQVKEVMGYVPPTPIPAVPSYFKGIMNLRGRVIAVLDIKEKLQYKFSDNYSAETVIILDLNHLRAAIIVDSVDKVISIDSGSISPPSDIEASLAIKYITGVAKVEEELIFILDMEAALNREDYSILTTENDEQKFAKSA